MLERLCSSGSRDAAVLSIVDLAAPVEAESDDDSDPSLDESEAKAAIALLLRRTSRP